MSTSTNTSTNVNANDRPLRKLAVRLHAGDFVALRVAGVDFWLRLQRVGESEGRVLFLVPDAVRIERCDPEGVLRDAMRGECAPCPDPAALAFGPGDAAEEPAAVRRPAIRLTGRRARA